MRKAITLLIIITLTLLEILTVNLNAGVNELELTPPTALQDGDVLIPHLYDLQFISSYLSVPYFGESRTELSVVVRYKMFRTAEYWERLISRSSEYNYGWRIYQDLNSTSMVFTYQGSDGVTRWILSTGPRGVNVFHHLAVTFSVSGGVARLYLNGSVVRSSTNVFEIGNNQQPLIIGDVRWQGAVGEVAIYNRALTNEEVEQAYSGVLNASSLAFLLIPTAFDGSKYVDLSGNNNHAYPYNGPLRVPAENPQLIVLRGYSNTSGLVLRFFPLGSKIYFSDGSYVVVGGDVNPVGLVDAFAVDRTDVVKVVIPRSLLPEFEFVRPEYISIGLGTAGVPMKLVLKPWGFNAVINRTNNEVNISGSESCTVSGTTYILRLLPNYTLITPCSTYNLTPANTWSAKITTLDYLDIQQLSNLRVNITYVNTSAMCGECGNVNYTYTMTLHNITISGTHKYVVLDRFRPPVSAALQSRSDAMYYVMLNEYPYMTVFLPHFKVIDTVNPTLGSVSAPLGSVLTSPNIKIAFENITYVLNAPIPTPPQLIMPHPDGDQAFIYESDVGEGITVKLYTNVTIYTSYSRTKQEYPAGTVLYVSGGSIHYTPSQKYLAIISPDPVIINFSSVIQVFNTSNPMAILLIPPTLLGEWALLTFYVIPIASYVARRSAPLAAVLTVLTSLMIMYVSTSEITKYISAATTAVAIAALILSLLRRSEL